MRFRSRRIAQFLVLAFMTGELSAAAADVLVLRSSGPSARHHPPGRRLPDNASFSLRPGDVVIVLTGGGTRTFRGPGTFSAAAAARASTGAAGPRRNTGAVRSQPILARPLPLPTDIWHIDATRSGRACAVVGTQPRLWRPDAAGPVRLTITPPTGDPQTIDWPAGEAVLRWPGSVPASDGASYQLSWSGEPTPRRLTLRFISPYASYQALGAALQANDCQSQLDIFIAQQAVRESPPAAGGRAGR